MAEKVYILSLWAGEEKLALSVEKGAVATKRLLRGGWGLGGGGGPGAPEDSSNRMVECRLKGKNDE